MLNVDSFSLSSFCDNNYVWDLDAQGRSAIGKHGAQENFKNCLLIVKIIFSYTINEHPGKTYLFLNFILCLSSI